MISDKSDMYMAGLGYNNLNGDYKIVVAESCNLHNNLIEVQIYDVKLDFCKTIKCDFPYKFISHTTPAVTHANGIPHWHVKRANNNGHSVILSFNLVAERFEEIALPENIFDFKFISALDGCLCIGLRDSLSDPFYVWKMGEYGRKNCWIKLEIVYHRKTRSCLMPLGFLEDQIVMNLDRVSLWSDRTGSGSIEPICFDRTISILSGCSIHFVPVLPSLDIK
ncbi:uncharacterized protein LOC126655536 [Mercurialis annua]|uniref:uncharacterized protein LOC126655536 n=1 Tax=Mercurialis annua TaxID=3986 RepID=UPI00215F95D9|nr:uncharacterized protein LOC126655536 [Mercurialis annua]